MQSMCCNPSRIFRGTLQLHGQSDGLHSVCELTLRRLWAELWNMPGMWTKLDHYRRQTSVLGLCNSELFGQLHWFFRMYNVQSRTVQNLQIRDIIVCLCRVPSKLHLLRVIIVVLNLWHWLLSLLFFTARMYMPLQFRETFWKQTSWRWNLIHARMMSEGVIV